ncbi:type III-B CRISPR module-associated protein Cmr5 [Pseudothermotoga thermarum]|uniref:CRISPR type III-B/RAMP module-associated protein Cmr5 n=1 Tax=Pseudothermotoga thermarum DSM 5069 TaxID=688269 RepID=F7YTM5_9THEM|nr:type III-B CRISPR module-associated protein Cmr5 [Pseudothermotoga thermarum]AEH51247.1 CRISPR-associated protein, Cmr5 family [Pseudothermotoga thermarum DSM 5069]
MTSLIEQDKDRKSKIEFGRAEFAYKCVENVIEKSKDIGKDLAEDYKSYSKKLPMMILTNGLAQALAFVFSKKKETNAWGMLYKHIKEYLCNHSIRKFDIGNEELTKWIISCDKETYRAATKEVLAFLSWVKRFAEGMIEDSEV